MKKNSDFIIPNWPAPINIHALQTSRYGAFGEGAKNGFSLAPYNNLNLGSHVGDSPMHVMQNRQFLRQFLPSEPVWLNQVHGINVVDAAQTDCLPEADASFTNCKNVVCVTMTADCLPILVCDTAGTIVASIHAGWRSLCNGVVEAAISTMRAKLPVNSANLMAWLGPAIGPNAFEVGAEVREQFLAQDASAQLAFKPHKNKFLCDIYTLAKQRLNHLGITQIYGGGECTYSHSENFFSYRRDIVTGRTATLVWLA